jgi:FAD/FMN-containing dehydrogenase
VKLVPEPKARALLVLGYPSVYEAGDHIPDIREHKPIGLEGIDDVLIEYMKKKHLHPDDAALLPEGGGWLLAEFGGDTRSEARDRARESMERLKRGANAVHMAVHDDPAKVAKLWEIRESGLGATAFVPEEPDTWPGWEDSAVPPEKVGAYLRDLRKLFHRYDYHCSLYGHFGQGCIHTSRGTPLRPGIANGVENKIRENTWQLSRIGRDRGKRTRPKKISAENHLVPRSGGGGGSPMDSFCARGTRELIS